MSDFDTGDEGEILTSESVVDFGLGTEEVVAASASGVLQSSMDAVGDDGVLAQLMDIREPLQNLRETLEQRLGADLTDYDFWLQDTQLLEPHMNLVDQCVQGEGLVQINVEIKVDSGLKKINIVDVLKPADDAVSEDEEDSSSQDTVTRWVVCAAFRKEQEKLNMPTDPSLWEASHVQHWLAWAQTTFKDASIDPADWSMTGAELCRITHELFKRKVVEDPSDLFWTHLELLRKCKFVAIVQTKPPGPKSPGKRYSIGPKGTSAGKPKKKPVTLGLARIGTSIPDGSPGNRSGNNGQIQLWQFLLELLTDKEHREVIHWLGEEGEFKLNNPEIVAQLWGNRKNKPNMNYEKLSRALRYYYDGDMICKVHGKRFVYKFVCDLKQLIGYSASELGQLVMEAEQRSLGRISLYE